MSGERIESEGRGGLEPNGLYGILALKAIYGRDGTKGAAARDRLCPCRRGAELAAAGGGGWSIGEGDMGLFEDSSDGCGETEAE